MSCPIQDTISKIRSLPRNKEFIGGDQSQISYGDIEFIRDRKILMWSRIKTTNNINHIVDFAKEHSYKTSTEYNMMLNKSLSNKILLDRILRAFSVIQELEMYVAAASKYIKEASLPSLNASTAHFQAAAKAVCDYVSAIYIGGITEKRKFKIPGKPPVITHREYTEIDFTKDLIPQIDARIESEMELYEEIIKMDKYKALCINTLDTCIAYVIEISEKISKLI
jgi:hypothetical protein